MKDKIIEVINLMKNDTELISLIGSTDNIHPEYFPIEGANYPKVVIQSSVTAEDQQRFGNKDLYSFNLIVVAETYDGSLSIASRLKDLLSKLSYIRFINAEGSFDDDIQKFFWEVQFTSKK